MIYCENNSQLAQSVKHLAQASNQDWPWTMIITRVKSGGYYVSDAISSELEEVADLMQKYFEEPLSTSTENTQAGQSLPE